MQYDPHYDPRAYLESEHKFGEYITSLDVWVFCKQNGPMRDDMTGIFPLQGTITFTNEDTKNYEYEPIFKEASKFLIILKSSNDINLNFFLKFWW